MRTFPNGGILIEPGDELPELDWECVYLDFETTSGDPKLSSVNPWRDCFIAGIAVCDRTSPAYYIPVGHYHGGNVDGQLVADWLERGMSQCRTWCNQNVKYDAHVLKNCCDVEPPPVLACTLTRAKLIDTDRMYKGGYSLDALAKAYLHEDIRPFEAALAPYKRKNKDYGRIPVDVLGEYACQDALTTRRLDHWQRANCPDQLRRVWDTETELTRILYEIEQRGMRVDPLQLQVKELQLTHRMLTLEQELHDLIGWHVRPHTNEDCFDVLCNKYGLPVFAYTEKGEPSFDKHALKKYLQHPYAPKEIVQRLLEYRKLHTLNGLFVTKFQKLHVNGIIHSIYNQVLRTGRMSCKDPNSQQNSKDAKALFLPRPGMAFMSVDYSQIEFRTIVHYIQDEDAIHAYNEDPDTDFHQWVANVCKIKRKPAKTVNFMMGFGGGKEKTVTVLSNEMDVVADVSGALDKLIAEGKLTEDQRMDAFAVMCRKRAEFVYDTYHNNLPTLKSTSRRCARACAARGYVFNVHGRRRHIPRDKSHIAFNAINQGEAADIMKERMVALRRVLPDDVHMIASVHDEVLLEGPVATLCSLQFVARVVECMETLETPLRVPVRVSVGVSTVSWRDASDDGCTAPVRLSWALASAVEGVGAGI